MNSVNEEGMGEVQPQPLPGVQDDSIPAAGTKNPNDAGPSERSKKAKICCNRCGWSHQKCAVFWAFFNLLQLVICYAILVCKIVFYEGIDTVVEGVQKIVKKLDDEEASGKF